MWNWPFFICGDYSTQICPVTFSNDLGLKIVLPKQVPVFISEITPKNLRGRFAAVNQVCTWPERFRYWFYRVYFKKACISISAAYDMLWGIPCVCFGDLYHLAYLGNRRYINFLNVLFNSSNTNVHRFSVMSVV